MLDEDRPVTDGVKAMPNIGGEALIVLVILKMNIINLLYFAVCCVIFPLLVENDGNKKRK